jgi:hypothetical protein
VEALEAFVECVCQSVIVEMGGHCFPSLDEKLEAWYDAPDGGSVLARERLLDV